TADALLACQATHGVLGGALVHVDDLVNARGVENLRQVSFRPAADTGNLRTFCRLQPDNLYRRVLLLEEFRYPHDGAGGTHGADEVGDAPAGVAPDLRPGGLVMGQRVVRVGKLVQHPALATRLHRLGQVTGAFHALFLAHPDQLGAVGAHGVLALLALVRRHDQLHAVAAHRRRHRQGDAGIAAGRLDQHVTGADIAARLRLDDHVQRRPVLDRAGGVV